MPHIYFTVTTDLSYDQRMMRICRSLANEGFTVTLVGRKLARSKDLLNEPFQQKRLTCFFTKGKFFYAEYNTRVFLYLLSKKMDALCAIDLDTILPVYYISRLKKVKRIYDAHELFCEMKEIVTRPRIYKTWKRIEQKTVPHFTLGYTVNKLIAEEFKKMYGVNYEVIRNIATKKIDSLTLVNKPSNYILYQGAVNEGRSFETLIPAMKKVHTPLFICGDGNLMQEVKRLVVENELTDKIFFKGMIAPAELEQYTAGAKIGITIFENNGLSNYYSLANRFFDYINYFIPQICVAYPVYKEINEKYEVALLVNDTREETLSNAINELLNNTALWQRLHENCKKAAEELNWENEEKKLIQFYDNLF